jgi:hypothetical protein
LWWNIEHALIDKTMASTTKILKAGSLVTRMRRVQMFERKGMIAETAGRPGGRP